MLTTGGTGLAPRDVTPEATRAVLEREAPGIAEHVRRGRGRLPRAALSRGVAGTRGRTLSSTFPARRAACVTRSARSTRSSAHALDVLRDRATDHSPGAAGAGGVAA